MVGDSSQSTLGNLSVTNAEAYIDDRAAHGFNAVWFNLLCDDYTYCNSNGTTYDGVKPFNTGTAPGSYDLSTENFTYFSRAHTIVQYAQTKGIEVFLNPIETGGCLAGGWFTTLENNGDGTLSTTDKDYGYGEYVGNTFKDLNNIVWFFGNDFYCNGDATAENDLKTVATGVRNTNPAAMMTLETNNTGSSLIAGGGTDPGWGSIIQLNGSYTYDPQYAEDRYAYTQTPTMPMYLQESNYEGEQVGTTDGCNTVRNCRLAEWWTMTSGATGQLYGCACTTHLTNANYPNDMDTIGVTQLGYQTTLLSSIDWWNLAPDSNGAGHLVTSGGGSCPTTGSIVSVTCVTAALDSTGNTALIYDPESTTITVDMTKMSGLTTAQWYDPTNGTYHSITGSPFTNTGTHDFAVPGARAGDSDWVLLLDR